MTTVTVDAAGVDTWSPAWYVSPESMAGRELIERACVKTAIGHLLPEPVFGHRIGYMAGTGLLYAEGHPTEDVLTKPGELPRAFAQLVAAMCDEGIPVPNGQAIDHVIAGRQDGFAGIRRADVTVNVRMGSREEGLAVLAGAAAVAKHQRAGATVVYGRDRHVETVYLGVRRKLGRVYDKGLEANLARRGELLRVEDQRRFVKTTRPTLDALVPIVDARGQAAGVRELFRRRFVPLWQAAKGVTVGGPMVLAEKLLSAVEAGEITATQAEKLAGHLVLVAAAGRRGAGLERTTMWRREQAARELGLVLGDAAMQEVEVRLDHVMEQVLDADCWGTQG